MASVRMVRGGLFRIDLKPSMILNRKFILLLVTLVALVLFVVLAVFFSGGITGNAVSGGGTVMNPVFLAVILVVIVTLVLRFIGFFNK